MRPDQNTFLILRFDCGVRNGSKNRTKKSCAKQFAYHGIRLDPMDIYFRFAQLLMVFAKCSSFYKLLTGSAVPGDLLSDSTIPPPVSLYSVVSLLNKVL